MPSEDKQPPQHDDDDKAAGDLTPEGADPDAKRRRHDELLDEGVEETFPASDPVAVKHIT